MIKILDEMKSEISMLIKQKQRVDICAPNPTTSNDARVVDQLVIELVSMDIGYPYLNLHLHLDRSPNLPEVKEKLLVRGNARY